MVRKPRRNILNWFSLRDKTLTRMVSEENPEVLHWLLICYQEIIGIIEYRKSQNVEREKKRKNKKLTRGK